MAYPGNPELSFQAQERVMTAFRQAVAKLQDGQREEAMIGLEFVLRLDPAFTPAVNLRQQLSSGAKEIDLGDIISQLQAPTTDTIDELLVEAVEDFNQRQFIEAKQKVEKALIELPGHTQARELLGQINDALKVENQVGQFLAQAREALALGDPQEAANFVMMAQALDPHHGGIGQTLQEIYDSGGIPRQEPAEAAAEEPLAFESADGGADDFAVNFGEADAPGLDIGGSEPPLGPAALEPASLESAAVDGPGGDVDDLPQPDFGAVLGGSEPAAEWTPATSGPDMESSLGAPLPDVPEPPPVPRLPEAPPMADDVADLFESTPEPVPEATPAPDDISDLFEAEPQAPGDAGLMEDAPTERQSVQGLLQAGDEAFERGDLLEAIDRWSRIYLFETADQGVSDRIEQAKLQLEETERRVDHLLFEAQDASLGGDLQRAGELIDEVLSLEPSNQKALELRAQLTDPAAANIEAPAAEMPDLEDDLFDDQEEIAEAIDDTVEPILPPEEIPQRRIFGLPVRTAAIIGGGVLVVLIVTVVLFSGLIGGGGGGGGDVYALRDRAEVLYKEGKADEALRLINDFQVSDPADQVVIDRMIERYSKALATPTPSPIPRNLSAARELYACGLWFHAYSEAVDGLRKHPDDPALTEIRAQIDEDESMAAILQSAISSSNFGTAAGIARDLLLTHPRQQDIEEVLDRCLFNAALAEMRTYNLTGAEGYLRELVKRRPGDEVVDRILEFIVKYKARPVDMTLKVFIGSLEERRRQNLSCQTDAASSTPTAIAAPAVEADAGAVEPPEDAPPEPE